MARHPLRAVARAAGDDGCASPGGRPPGPPRSRGGCPPPRTPLAPLGRAAACRAGQGRADEQCRAGGRDRMARIHRAAPHRRASPVQPARLDEAGHALAGHSEVAFAAATTGPANLISTALFSDTDHLYQYLTGELARLPGVRSVETAPIIRTLKRTGSVH